MPVADPASCRAVSCETTTYVIATTTFHGPGDLTVVEGTIKRSDDPIVKAHPNVLRPVEDAVD